MKNKIIYLLVIIILIAAIAFVVFTGRKETVTPAGETTTTIPNNMSVSGEVGGN